jgi:DNA-binding NtrC family response regulator
MISVAEVRGSVMHMFSSNPIEEKVAPSIAVSLLEEPSSDSVAICKMLSAEGIHYSVFSSLRQLAESQTAEQPSVVMLSLSQFEPDVLRSARMLKQLSDSHALVVLANERLMGQTKQLFGDGVLHYLLHPVGEDLQFACIRNAMELLSYRLRVRALESRLEFAEQQSSSDAWLQAAQQDPLVSWVSQQGEDEVLPLDELEKHAIMRALKLTEGNIEKAARQLGIGRATLYRRLAQYDDIDALLFRSRR